MATSTRLRLSPYPADTCTIDAPAERAASSTRRSSSTLSVLATVFGVLGDVVGAIVRCLRVSGTVRVAAPPCRAAAAAASAAVRRPASLRSLVWANPVVSPATTRMPAPRSRPLVTCSTRPSSSPADVERLSSA